MAAADTSLSALVDIASVPESPAPTPEPVTEPVAEPSTTVPEIGTVDDQPAPEQVDLDAPPQVDGAEPQVDARTNPAQIRSALKALRDSDPKNAPVARALNDAYGRYTAYKDSFPTVADARNAKAFLDANGGIEGLTNLHETIQSVNETDALLYAGDPKVLDSLIEDMRSEGKLDAFSKLAPAFLDKLRGLDEKSYFATMKPHFYQGLVDVGIPGVVQNLVKALSGETPDVESAKGLLSEFANWFNNLRDSVEKTDRTRLDPDRQAFEKERTEWATQRQREFNDGIAKTADEYNNTSLGKHLKPFLKLPFFKQLTGNRDALLDLAAGLKSQLLSELTADKQYQSQMDAFFAAKSPDQARIQQYHQSKVDTIARRIVQSVIERRYPNYAKSVTPAAPAKRTETPAAAAAPGSKPEYVKAKPSDEQIDWEKDPSRILFITGKAYLRNGKFVQWGKKPV